MEKSSVYGEKQCEGNRKTKKIATKAQSLRISLCLWHVKRGKKRRVRVYFFIAHEIFLAREKGREGGEDLHRRREDDPLYMISSLIFHKTSPAKERSPSYSPSLLYIPLPTPQGTGTPYHDILPCKPISSICPLHTLFLFHFFFPLILRAFFFTPIWSLLALLLLFSSLKGPQGNPTGRETAMGG